MEAPASRIIVARKIIPGPGDPALRGHGIVVRGGRIVAVEPLAELPPALETIDLGEQVLFPGLIDTHVHLGFDGSPVPERLMLEQGDTVLRAHMERQAAALLGSGVTTVRDLGCRGTVCIDVANGSENAAHLPRVLAAGEPLGVAGGHCDYMSTACDSSDQLLDAIARRAYEGAQAVKIMLTGGFIDDDGGAAFQVVYSEQTLLEATEYARSLGLRVAVHAHNVEGIMRAARAGVASIEHCSMIERQGIAEDAALYRELAASGTVVVPTVSALWNADLPWASQDRALDAIRSLVNHRVPLAYGTDTGIPGAFPGRPLDGLEILMRAGMSAADALRSATTQAAHALGMTQDIGRIAPGRYADFVALDEDPRRDIGVLDNLREVFTSGRVIDSVV